MIEKIRQWFFHAEIWAAGLPAVWNTVVTSGFHGLIAAVIALVWGGGFAGFAAATTLYGFREVEQLVREQGDAPWFDRVADVAVPLIVALIIWIL